MLHDGVPQRISAVSIGSNKPAGAVISEPRMLDIGAKGGIVGHDDTLCLVFLPVNHFMAYAKGLFDCVE
jgi:hypothetical protein